MTGLDVIIMLVTAAFAGGVFLIVTAFSREPAPTTDVPPAQIVTQAAPPARADKGRVRISAGRLIGAMFLIALGAGGVMLIIIGRALADVSRH